MIHESWIALLASRVRGPESATEMETFTTSRAKRLYFRFVSCALSTRHPRSGWRNYAPVHSAGVAYSVRMMVPVGMVALEPTCRSSDGYCDVPCDDSADYDDPSRQRRHTRRQSTPSKQIEIHVLQPSHRSSGRLLLIIIVVPFMLNCRRRYMSINRTKMIIMTVVVMSGVCVSRPQLWMPWLWCG